MKKIVSHFCYIFVALILACCNNNTTKKINNIQLIKVKDFILNVDSTTNYNFINTQVYEDNLNTYLIGYDYTFQTINIFNLSNKLLVKKIKLNSEGENAILRADGFLFHNFDSIFIFHRFPSIIYLIDTTGRISKKWDVNASLPDELSSLKYIVEVDPMDKQSYFDSNKQVLYFLMYYQDPSFVNALTFPIIGEFSLKQGKIDKVWGKHPISLLNLIKEQTFYGNYKIFPRFIINDSITVISHIFSQQIDIYNKGSFTRSKTAKSSFITKFKEWKIEYQGFEKENKYNVEEPAYDGLLFDKFHNLYFRIAKHYQSYNKNNSKLINTYFESAWSLIILNKNFDLVSETTFEAGKFDFSNVFITSKGLLIKQLDNNEGIITLTLFKIAN
jgi:hypothetical protein